MTTVHKSDIGLLSITAMTVGFGLGSADSMQQWWAWLVRLVLIVNFFWVFSGVAARAR